MQTCPHVTNKTERETDRMNAGGFKVTEGRDGAGGEEETFYSPSKCVQHSSECYYRTEEVVESKREKRQRPREKMKTYG